MKQKPKTKRQLLNEKRDVVLIKITELVAIHGSEAVESAMRKHLFVTATKRRLNDEIERRKDELKELQEKL